MSNMFLTNVFVASVMFSLGTSATDFHCPKSLKRDGCLTTEDMNFILSRWALIFDSNHTGSSLEDLVTCTVSKDFKAYDKTFTFGQGGSGLQTDSRKTFISQQQSAYDTRQYGAIQPGGSFSKVFAFHSCDRIAFRWSFKGKTSGKTKCTSTVNTDVGDPVDYNGIDLLEIEAGSIRIQEVITSGVSIDFRYSGLDWLNDFLAIGADFNGSSICPGTSPPPCDPDCGMCSRSSGISLRNLKLL